MPEFFFGEYSSDVRRDARRDKAILNGERPRLKGATSYQCLADPQEHFLGGYLLRGQVEASLRLGSLPTGSFWYNDHKRRVYEVIGQETSRQTLREVTNEHLIELKENHPFLRMTLCQRKVF